METEQKIGNIFGFTGGNYAGNVYDKDHLSPTLNTMQGGCKQPMIIDEPKCLNSKGGRGDVEGLQPSLQDRVYSTDAVSTAITTSFMPNILEDKTIVAMRGRNPDNPSDRTVGSPTEQRLEANTQGTSNCLTSVQKDNLLLEKPQYRIRKLTPRECGRLMGVSDEDIDKMAAVNSNTQLYKQFGNSIVVDVLCDIFKQLNIEQDKEN